MLTAVSIVMRLVRYEARPCSLLFVSLLVVILERRLLTWLRRVLGIGGDVLTMMLFFLLHFLVVSDVAWIGHGISLAW
ncbi:hypothetical protein AX284_11200 [Pseudomonas sp. HUK17]|uniref:Uncharacterized protein n=1 Tax=Pseudomonas oryzihabitans TaxID=47885 RepID=A0A178LB57_9PSED|nr:hypothetical protein AX284_11200 [Pseudomonas sp. HUK17]OAN26759.1 hypothetical protein A4V15_22550 [Pseudomonas oryzihabitans]